MSTSKTNCTINSPMDVKTYQKPLQTITKYFVPSSSSKGTHPVKSADSPVLPDNSKGTLILQETPSDSSPNSSGVFKVTAKPTIDITKGLFDRFLLDDHFLIPGPPKPRVEFTETVTNNAGKRTSNESSKNPPAKKAKSDLEEKNVHEKTNSSKQTSPGNVQLPLEFSEDEEENKDNPVNGDTESTEVYFCKHCDYSDVSLRCVSTHYENYHPFIRYNPVYIQDPSDESATFRCLECPVDFSKGTELKRHYKENHPDAPNVFTVQSCTHCLVFRCFVCSFTSNALKALKEHYKKNHPTHKEDNPLMYCRYLATRSQEETKALSPERPPGIPHESARIPCKEVKNAPSLQHSASKGADVPLYHCHHCKFSHKSIVVLHVHYQKCHPEEAVTIDRIKQPALVKSHTAAQITPDKDSKSVTIVEKSTPQKNISNSSKETKNKTDLSLQDEISLSLSNSKHTPGASKSHSKSATTEKVKSTEDQIKRKKSPNKHIEEMSTGTDSSSHSSPNIMFHCQFCNYSNTHIKSVLGHHNAKHSAHTQAGIEDIVRYSAMVHKMKLQSEAEASARTTSSDSQSRKQVKVCSGGELHQDKYKAEDAAMTKYNAFAHAENLFYCQECNYGNKCAQGVLTHQARVHQSSNSKLEHVLEYTALIREEIEKSKSQVKTLSFVTDLPLPILNEGDKDMFFCHFCNYRQRTVNQVLGHYLRKHRGFAIKREQVHLYTSMVLKQTETSAIKAAADNKKTKKLGEVLASPPVSDAQPQRTLQCSRCSYSTQYLYLLRKHMYKVHKTNRTVSQLLRLCFKQGHLQAGYHCYFCVFSHQKAIAVYKHCREHHKTHCPSLEYIMSRLYVGPETHNLKKKKPQKHTDVTHDNDGSDGSLPSQKSGQNETKTYSCRACSFKGSSLTSITCHYRAVHPWSVKEDGSVLSVINSKKQSANRQLEDRNEMPVSLDTCQADLDFDSTPGSSHESISSSLFKCLLCPAMFSSLHGLSTHSGMKHAAEETENVDKQQEDQDQVQTRVHVFKCPHCTYVNTNYQGVLTHCQMRHHGLISRADSLYLNAANSHNWEDSLKRNGSGFRLIGYMCNICQQICATLEKLNEHCEKSHNESMAITVPDKTSSAPNTSAVIKKKYMSLNNKGSVSKASFLSKKRSSMIKCQYCPYKSPTKVGLGRHLHVHHKNTSASKAQDCSYKCALCSSSFAAKTLLGKHYAEKHGQKAFLKYYAPQYEQVHEKPAPMAPDHPLIQEPGNTSVACKSSTTAEEKKISVFKCPSCPYVNASYHGVLTHCQMKHPEVVARADDLQTDEILTSNMVKCTMGKGSNERGYMCKKCPQIHVSLKKLKIHCERDHKWAEATASKRSVETETEKRPDHSSQGPVSKTATLKNKTSPVSSTDISLSYQVGTPETCQSKPLSVKAKEPLYQCHICNYVGSCRKYLYYHYKNTHKFDSFTRFRLLQRYNKRKRVFKQPQAKSNQSAVVKCKICTDLNFDSSQMLIAHYSTFHSSDFISDFIVLSQASKKSTGLYKCALCKKKMNGIRKLWHHLDGHREGKKSMAKTTPEDKSIELCKQDELPMLETAAELTLWNVTPVETFTLPSSPLATPSKDDLEQPKLESTGGKHICKPCGRTFMSAKGLRWHERSHAALAAIKKKVNNASTSETKHNISQYIIYKPGTVKPFLCSFCSYRTTFMGLWRSHFMKKHQDVSLEPAETDNQDEESAQMRDKEPSNLSEELNKLPEHDEEPEDTEISLYSEPPDVQRQLNHYSLMAQAGAPCEANVQENNLPGNSLLHCEVCNFNTGHMSSIRRHYLNRHGKKLLRCKDCNFFTVSRRTLEMHMETGHSTCQSVPTHQKDLCCPFCLYQTKNKNNMIDHIVLHREERVVPIEVRRSKLSRCLRGIVFRCHKCTFTSGSAENLRSHMMRHDDIKPYKCRLCYFDCTHLSDLEAHLSDKHQVVRNHELVGQISLDRLEARVDRMNEEEEEPLSDLEHHNNDMEDVKTEEIFTDCDEVSEEVQAENLADKNIRGKITQQMKESYQRQGQDGKNGNKESPAKSSVLDLQCDNTKPNSIVQEKHEHDPQEQAETVILPKTAGRKEIENRAKQKVDEGKNAEIQFEDCSDPEMETWTNENQAQSNLKDGEDSSDTFIQPKVEAEEGSPTCAETAEKVQAYKLHIKALKHRALNIEARIENDILRHILLLDEDGNICKIQKKADQERTVKIEQSFETEVTSNLQNVIPLLDEESCITLANCRRNPVNREAVSAFAKKIYVQGNNIEDQERVTVKRPLSPNCRQLKISQNDLGSVSFTNCKVEQVQNQKNHEDASESYEEMPVLENEYLKEEMMRVDCCKEEDQNDHLELKQEEEDEMICEDGVNRCTNQEHQGDGGIKEAENPHVPKVTDGEADVFRPTTTEEKLFTCELCGRNLMNSSELVRHRMRHGM